MESLDSLEGLLRWFHFSCKSALDALPPQTRTEVLGNVDVKAADVLFATARHLPFRSVLGPHFHQRRPLGIDFQNWVP